MVEELVKVVFEKSKEETPSTSKTGLARHISDKIDEKYSGKKLISYKTLTRYYDKYIEGKEGVIEEPQSEIIERLCQYLGYTNYHDFVNQQKGQHIIDLSLDKLVDSKRNIDIALLNEIKEVKEIYNGDWIRKITITVSITIPSMTVLYFGMNH